MTVDHQSITRILDFLCWQFVNSVLRQMIYGNTLRHTYGEVDGKPRYAEIELALFLWSIEWVWWNGMLTLENLIGDTRVKLNAPRANLSRILFHESPIYT